MAWGFDVIHVESVGLELHEQLVAIVVLVVGADPGSSWSFGHSQVTDSDGVEIDGGGVLVVGMDPEDPLLVTALDDEPV